jgi:microcystin-dependent protein
MSTPYVGEIRLFGFSRVPVGWAACNGQLLPINQYQVLFTLLGTTYGGDGVNTFAVPDLQGRVPIHQGQGLGLTNHVLGEMAGTESVTLLTTQMPQHTHTACATSNPANANAPGTTVLPGTLTGTDTMYASDISGAASFALQGNALSAQGGNGAHDNTMPTLTVSYCIAYEGIFPSQS